MSYRQKKWKDNHYVLHLTPHTTTDRNFFYLLRYRLDSNIRLNCIFRTFLLCQYLKSYKNRLLLLLLVFFVPKSTECYRDVNLILCLLLGVRICHTVRPVWETNVALSFPGPASRHIAWFVMGLPPATRNLCLFRGQSCRMCSAVWSPWPQLQVGDGASFSFLNMWALTEAVVTSSYSAVSLVVFTGE